MNDIELKEYKKQYNINNKKKLKQNRINKKEKKRIYDKQYSIKNK